MPETPEVFNSNPLVREALDRIPFSQESLFVVDRILIPKKVDWLNVRYRTFGDESRQLILDTMRAWDAEAKEIRTERDIAELTVVEHMLKTLIDSEKVREAGPEGASYIAGELAIIRELMMLGREYRGLSLITNAANYAAANKATVDFAAATIGDTVIAATESVDFPIRGMLLSQNVRRTLKANAVIKARYPEQQITDEVLADFFELDEIIVTKAKARTTTDAVVTPLVTGKALLYARDDGEGSPLNNRTLGRMAYRPYGGLAFDTRQTPPQGVELLIEAGVAATYAPVVTNFAAGYLFTQT